MVLSRSRHGNYAGWDHPPDAGRVPPRAEPRGGHGGVRGRRPALDADVHGDAPGRGRPDGRARRRRTPARPLPHRGSLLAPRAAGRLAAALAAERTAAGRGAMRAVHLAGVLRRVRAGVRAPLTVERRTELALHLIKIGIRASPVLSPVLIGPVLIGGNGLSRRVVRRGTGGPGFVDSHAASYSSEVRMTASHTRA